jgi:hypothetical protein
MNLCIINYTLCTGETTVTLVNNGFKCARRAAGDRLTRFAYTLLHPGEAAKLFQRGLGNRVIPVVATPNGITFYGDTYMKMSGTGDERAMGGFARNAQTIGHAANARIEYVWNAEFNIYEAWLVASREIVGCEEIVCKYPTKCHTDGWRTYDERLALSALDSLTEGEPDETQIYIAASNFEAQFA